MQNLANESEAEAGVEMEHCISKLLSAPCTKLMLMVLVKPPEPENENRLLLPTGAAVVVVVVVVASVTTVSDPLDELESDELLEEPSEGASTGGFVSSTVCASCALTCINAADKSRTCKTILILNELKVERISQIN